jgi:hypothetical protein
MVLTIPNAPDGELKRRIRQLFQAFREWRNQGRRTKGGGYWREVQGYSYKLEIDWSPKAFWHPHIHAILHVPRGFAARHGDPAREAWSRITATAGARACERNGLWLTKVNSTNIAREVAKYAHKPLQIAHAPLDRLIELAWATHRTRFCTSQGSLRHVDPDHSDGSGRYEWLGNLITLLEDPTLNADERSQVYQALERACETNDELRRFYQPHWFDGRLR